ncbi:MAG: helix-turn-helix transcriptional regulator [Oculatellaceae cyanobacterium Prado106]|nr:helix-turn-helix transcriptional regulator [Oculatellaceae cyanobacterium Prado106]
MSDSIGTLSTEALPAAMLSNETQNETQNGTQNGTQLAQPSPAISSLEPLADQPLRMSHLIRQFRQLLGLTQEQFAGKMGVTLPTINRWENDRAKPSPLALLRIRSMLVDLSQSPSETHRNRVQHLLTQYFSDEAF